MPQCISLDTTQMCKVIEWGYSSMEYDCMKGSIVHILSYFRVIYRWRSVQKHWLQCTCRQLIHCTSIGCNVCTWTAITINNMCIVWLSSLVFRQDRAYKASPSLHLSKWHHPLGSAMTLLERTLHSEKDEQRHRFKKMSIDRLRQLREYHTKSYTI